MLDMACDARCCRDHSPLRVLTLVGVGYVAMDPVVKRVTRLQIRARRDMVYRHNRDLVQLHVYAARLN